MKIKSENKFRVKTSKFKKNCQNMGIRLDLENGDLVGRKSYGTADCRFFGSENFLYVKLEEGGIVTLSLSTFGGMAGFEFDTDKLYPTTIKRLGDFFDVAIMIDVVGILDDCVRETL